MGLSDPVALSEKRQAPEELPMRNFLVNRWFLIALVLVLAIGIGCAESLAGLASSKGLRDSIVAGVMFCMAMPLQGSTMLRAMRSPGPPVLAVCISYGVLPAVTWLVAKWLPGDYGPGLLVAAATPCTLASASVWTRRAGGNDSVATLVTLLTNASCAMATPGLLVLMLGRRVGFENPDLSFAKMTRELLVLVLLPMVVAQILRWKPIIAELATRRRVEFSVAAQCGILSMVFLGAIRTGLKLREASSGIAVGDVLATLFAVLFVHLSMFWLGTQLAKQCGFPRADQIAVGFSGSQKTLMVGLVTAINLQVTILPMVAYHCLQLFVDTLIADGYRRRGEKLAGKGPGVAG